MQGPQDNAWNAAGARFPQSAPGEKTRGQGGWGGHRGLTGIPSNASARSPYPHKGLSQKQGGFSVVLTAAPSTAPSVHLGRLLCAGPHAKGWTGGISVQHVGSPKLVAPSPGAQRSLSRAVVGYVPVLNLKRLAVGGHGSPLVYLTEPRRNECSA